MVRASAKFVNLSKNVTKSVSYGQLWRSTLGSCVDNPTRLPNHKKEQKVNPTYLLARDHLQRAAIILQGSDQRSRQLRHIIERTIGLMDDCTVEQPKQAANVYDFSAYRRAAEGGNGF